MSLITGQMSELIVLDAPKGEEKPNSEQKMLRVGALCWRQSCEA